jgi:hypothetical protein
MFVEHSVKHETPYDFMIDAKKKAEEINPDIKKLSEIEPFLYQPIYGYIISFSSN